MKKEHVLWASLLLCLAPAPLKADPEEGEEHTNITDTALPPLKPMHSFCALKADDGPCKAMMKRFFFNIFTQQCEEFVYGGCEGNQNRFESLEECKKICVRVYDFQVDDYKTQHDVWNNNSLTPQPTKVPTTFATKERTNDGWKNADHIYQVFLNAFCIHASMFFLGLDNILCTC
ncbi:PREDICTED: tissue factor pathway inhibitor [Propithecus coquereli]|nr:PREDICTED: tissue factor pathway inhibitor [Propithecus coquereli]